MGRCLKCKVAYVLLFALLIVVFGETIGEIKVYAGDITVEFNGSNDYLVSMTEDNIMLSRYHRRRNSSVYWTYKTVGFVVSLSVLDNNSIEEALENGKACEIELVSNRDIYNTDNVQSIYTIDKNRLCEAVDMLGIEFGDLDTGKNVNVYISNVFVVYKRTLENGVEVKAEYESEYLYNRNDMDKYLYEQAGLTWGASGSNIDKCYNNKLSVTWNIRYGVNVGLYDAESGVFLENALSKVGMNGYKELFRGQEWEMSASRDEFIYEGIVYRISDSSWSAECKTGQNYESGNMIGRNFKWRHIFAGEADICIWCEPIAEVEFTPTPTVTVPPTIMPLPTATVPPTIIPSPTVTVSPTSSPSPTATPRPTSRPVPEYEIQLRIDGTDGTGWVKGGGYVKRGATTYINTNATDSYVFVGWYLNGECISTAKGCTVTVTEAAIYTAKYKKVVGISPTVTTTPTPVIPDFIESIPCITEKPERMVVRALQSGFVKDAEIISDVSNGSNFDVRNGIAVQEYLAASLYVVPYILEYDIEKVCGKQLYDIEVCRKYILEWKAADGSLKKEEQVVRVNIPVEREYSYWQVNYFECYVFDGVTLKNDAFETGRVEISTINGENNEVKFEQRSTHIKAPEAVEKGIELESCVLRSESERKPQINMELFVQEVRATVDGVKKDGTPWVDRISVFNDILVVDGVSIFETGECKGSGGAAYLYGLENKNIYKDKIEIKTDAANGKYETAGIIHYKAHEFSMGQEMEITESFESPFLNFFVHTPVYCAALVEADNDKYVQLVKPTENAVNLVIDENSLYNDFVLEISNYGAVGFTQGLTERDFSKLMRDEKLSNIEMICVEEEDRVRNEVYFPFEIFVDVGNNYDTTDDYFIEAETWIVVGTEKQRFYTGAKVSEGLYTAKVRTVAANCGEKTSREERNANCDYRNYVAVDFFDIRVSGRLFGLKINRVNAVGWEDDTVYTVGELNEYGRYNGSSQRERLPLKAGSNKKYDMSGVLKKGTIVEFSIDAMGDALSYGSFLVIRPRFYHVTADGKDRKEVDMYYDFIDSTGEMHLLVRSGGTEDRQNYVYGTSSDKTGSPVPVLCGYSEIVLKEARRTAQAEKQYRYHGFYTLPEGAHFVEKDFDVEEYCAKYGITYEEAFWIKGGYIIVNFDISVYDGRYNEQLSYINKSNSLSGMMNMWALEVNGRYEKTDAYGKSFVFEDGDVMLFYTDKDANSGVELKPIK